MHWRREEDRFPPRTAGLAVEWLEENYRHAPFFLWVDFFDPHEPWDPPEYMVKKYHAEYSGIPMLHPNYGKANDLLPEELENLRAHYCAEAELVDRWLGRIFQKIDDLDLWDDTIIVFTTDHGMSLGEHNRTGKSNINESDDRFWPIYPEIAHIPFIIVGPGLEWGKTVGSLAQPVDVLPTLLDLAGLDVTPPEPFHGRSFAPLLKGDSAEPVRDVAVTGNKVRTEEDGQVPKGHTTPVVYTDRWAYVPVGATGNEELYDLTGDPRAEHDVASANPDMLKEMQERLMAWFKEMDAPAEAVEVFEKNG
jgi:arylsulfatase A-like enzyme